MLRLPGSPLMTGCCCLVTRNLADIPRIPKDFHAGCLNSTSACSSTNHYSPSKVPGSDSALLSQEVAASPVCNHLSHLGRKATLPLTSSSALQLPAEQPDPYSPERTGTFSDHIQEFRLLLIAPRRVGASAAAAELLPWEMELSHIKRHQIRAPSGHR